MNKNLTELVHKELSRKDFLKFIGGGLIALLGMNNLIAYLSHQSRTTAPQDAAESRRGFGSSKFGA